MLHRMSECIQEVQHLKPIHLIDLYLEISEDDFPDGECLIWGTYPITGYGKTREYIAMRFMEQREDDGLRRERLLILHSTFGDEILVKEELDWRRLLTYMAHTPSRRNPFYDDRQHIFCLPLFKKEVDDQQLLVRTMERLSFSEETLRQLNAFRTQQPLIHKGKTYARRGSIMMLLRYLHHLLLHDKPLENLFEFRSQHGQYRYLPCSSPEAEMEWWNRPRHPLFLVSRNRIKK